MTRSEPDDGAQCSVAELLARYGDEAPTTGRRRRRAPEGHHTAPQAIIERVQTDSGPLPVMERPRRRHSAEPDPGGHGRTRTDLGDRGSAGFTRHGRSDSNGHRLPELNGHGLPDLNGHHLPDLNGHGLPDLNGHHLPDLNGDGLPDLNGHGLPDLNGHSAPDLNGHSSPDLNGHSAYRASSTELDEDNWMGLPPVGVVPQSRGGRVLSSGPVTEELPRLDPVPPNPALLEPASLEPASLDSWPDPAPVSPPRPLSGEPPAGLGASTQLVPAPELDDRGVVGDSGPAWNDADLSYDAEDDPYPPVGGQQALHVEDDEEEPRSPVREWAVMAVQIGVGVLGGALLWLVCQWLWLQLPALALVVALVVITGLVWVVRRVRRAEDLQTTVIAVLVGLFVTVSPAALLLVGR